MKNIIADETKLMDHDIDYDLINKLIGQLAKEVSNKNDSEIVCLIKRLEELNVNLEFQEHGIRYTITGMES